MVAPGGPLVRLEALRRDSVEALARGLREARAALHASKLLAEEAQRASLQRERQLRDERERFAAACSVRQLQAGEARLRALAADLAASARRAVRAASALQHARAEVDALTRQLLAAERGRRAVDGVIESQRRQSQRASERADEDDAEQAFHTRR